VVNYPENDFWNKRHLWSKALTKGRGSVGKRGAFPLSFSRRGGLRG